MANNDRCSVNLLVLSASRRKESLNTRLASAAAASPRRLVCRAV